MNWRIRFPRALGAALFTFWVLSASVEGTLADSAQTAGACSPVIVGTDGDVRIDIDCPSGLSPRQLEELKNAFADTVLLQGPLVERLEALSGRFHVQKAALANFFTILEENNVPAEGLDNALRQIAKRHLELIARLDRTRSDDPEIEALRRAAKSHIEEGDYDDAEADLRQAENLDLAAIEEAQAAIDKRFLRAAETRSERAEIKETQFDYAAAAQLFESAAGLVPAHRPLVMARYADRAGTAFQSAGLYEPARVQLEKALSIRERELGQDATETAISLNNLAALYRTTGRYAEAEPLYKRALAIDEESLGARIIQVSPSGSTTWRYCTELPAATPRRSRCTNARWRSMRRS